MRALHLAISCVTVTLALTRVALAQPCAPACGDGRVCVNAMCVSACSPACPEGLVCTGSATTAQCAASSAEPTDSPWQEGEPTRDALRQPQPVQPGLQPVDDTGAFRPALPPSPTAEEARALIRVADPHTGFLGRLSLGGAYVGGSEAVGPATRTLNGFGAILSIVAGGTIAGSLAIGAELSAMLILNPVAKLDDGMGSGSGAVEGTLQYTSFGPTFIYYVLPYNLHFGSMLGVGVGTLEPADPSSVALDDIVGFTSQISLGWETLISNRWGIGAAVRGAYFHLDGEADTFAATALTVELTTTYN